MLAGAAIGACVGGFYGLVLVSYRDMIAARQAGTGVGPDGKPCKPCEEKRARELAQSPELHDTERTVERVERAEFISTAEAARAIRAQHPEMRWQDAMKQAAATKNGAGTQASEEATDGS